MTDEDKLRSEALDRIAVTLNIPAELLDAITDDLTDQWAEDIRLAVTPKDQL